MTIKDYVSPYESVSEVQEKWKLVPAFLETRGLVKQHLGLGFKPTDILTVGQGFQNCISFVS